MLSSSEIDKAVATLTATSISGAPRFDIAAHCFDAQRPFATSSAKFITASCSRRSGKSEASAAKLIDAALSKPGCVALYVTLTLKNAKRIVWGILKRINREKALGGEAKEAELRMEFPNGSNIYLAGANNREEIEKFRGMPIVLVILDEAQLLKNLEELINDTLTPALMDYDGKVVLAGTPAPVPAGYFWECIQNPEWEHFSWTVFENPWIKKKSGKSPKEHLDAELKRRGVTVDDPSIQREWFGRWVYDPNSLVFSYSAERNSWDGTLPQISSGEWECVIGGDIGFDDADALCVLKWNTSRPDLWLVHEDVMPKQSISALGGKLCALVDEFRPLSVVLDFGGLGKKIADELTQRWSLRIEAAEKERKNEHIELLNDALRTGVFHAKKDSRFAQDSMLVEWDKTNPEKWKISERFHSDICDAVLYGYRRALQWNYKPDKKPAPKLNSPEWFAAEKERREKEEEEMLQREMDQLRAQLEEEREPIDDSLSWI